MSLYHATGVTSTSTRCLTASLLLVFLLVLNSTSWWFLAPHTSMEISTSLNDVALMSWTRIGVTSDLQHWHRAMPRRFINRRVQQKTPYARVLQRTLQTLSEKIASGSTASSANSTQTVITVIVNEGLGNHPA
ncbi:hypothetical protein DEU56DRAFT_833369 [Suillus clintonianus]|uniref:uncharacterized protein n=1 Tax=Suillus clintonianus TaxID=1904413 RepID=UPI001B87C9CC|nr:uncharacterized protein DEU56DRAFT_833369 [Suillus clintonianus]KAG2121857.1 hypothetical protein DEU56DRAFT_833369 [Suillus clintonianus]